MLIKRDARKKALYALGLMLLPFTALLLGDGGGLHVKKPRNKDDVMLFSLSGGNVTDCSWRKKNLNQCLNIIWHGWS